MPESLKQIISITVVLIVVFVAYYGTYLPYQKSHAFIVTLGSKIESLATFKEKFSEVLDVPSPIGQPEIMRNITNTALSVLDQLNDAEAIQSVVSYIEGRHRPLTVGNRGMSFLQDLYVLGTMNELAFVKTQELRYAEAAKKYFLEGYAVNPTRPQFAYALFDIYRIENNVEKAKEMAEHILKLWPTEEKIPKLLEDFLNRQLTETR